MLVLWPFLAGIQFNMSQSITTSPDCASVFLSLCSSSAWAVLLVSSSTVTAAVIAGDVVASVTWAPSQKSWVVLYEARAQVQLPGGLGPVVLQNISDLYFLTEFKDRKYYCNSNLVIYLQSVCKNTWELRYILFQGKKKYWIVLVQSYSLSKYWRTAY